MFKRLRDYRILPLVSIENPDDSLHVAEALINANLPVMELFFRKHSDTKAIKSIRKEFPNFWIGAYSVLNKDILLRVIDAGAYFAFAPGVNPETIEEAQKREFNFAPGVCTPTDIETALLLGEVNFQFYPAELSGGTAMLNTLIESFSHLGIEFAPKGGITPTLVNNYLEIPQVAAVSVDWIADRTTIASKEWGKITKVASEALKRVK